MRTQSLNTLLNQLHQSFQTTIELLRDDRLAKLKPLTIEVQVLQSKMVRAFPSDKEAKASAKAAKDHAAYKAKILAKDPLKFRGSFVGQLDVISCTISHSFYRPFSSIPFQLAFC